MTDEQKSLLDTFFSRALQAYENTDSFWQKFADWTNMIDAKWEHKYTQEIVRRVIEFEKATTGKSIPI